MQPSRSNEGVTDFGALESKAEQLQQTGQTVIFAAVDKEAAGLLYPFFGLLLSPIVAGAAMSFSSVSVIGNALRLRKEDL